MATRGYENVKESDLAGKVTRGSVRPASEGTRITQKPPSKYRSVKTEVDGIVFHSAKEARRYGELKLLEKAGEISDLQLQPNFELVVYGLAICGYRGDFRYREKGAEIVEDCKGMRTPVYKLKKRLMLACLNVEIRET